MFQYGIYRQAYIHRVYMESRPLHPKIGQYQFLNLNPLHIKHLNKGHS